MQMHFERVAIHVVTGSGLLEDMWLTWEPMVKAEAKRRLHD